MPGDSSKGKLINIHKIVCNTEWCQGTEGLSSSLTHLKFSLSLYLVGMGQVTMGHPKENLHCPVKGTHLFYHQHCPPPPPPPHCNAYFQHLLWSQMASTSDLTLDLLKRWCIGKPHLEHGCVPWAKVGNNAHAHLP